MVVILIIIIVVVVLMVVLNFLKFLKFLKFKVIIKQLFMVFIQQQLINSLYIKYQYLALNIP